MPVHIGLNAVYVRRQPVFVDHRTWRREIGDPVACLGDDGKPVVMHLGGSAF
ncbi:hypothetical protein U8P76_32310 (plasmid) [Rhizobium johnstonii]|nr:hypothetical protein U8P76_32310 [Rhizobium johnstonii]